MARDIEEFLRKAAERRQQQNQGGKPAQQPQQPGPAQPVRPAAPPQRRPPPRPPVVEPIVLTDVEIVEPAPSRLRPANDGLRNESVADHVKNHINSSRLSEQSSHLGEGIADVHERVESRVHQHLDHDISVVDDKPTITDDMPSNIFGAASNELAKELLQMLQDPKAVGKSIIVAEILKRPQFD